MAYRYRALMKPAPEGYVLRQDRREPPRFPHILGKLGVSRRMEAATIAHRLGLIDAAVPPESEKHFGGG